MDRKLIGKKGKDDICTSQRGCGSMINQKRMLYPIVILIVISVALLAPACRAQEPTPAPTAGTAQPAATSEPTAERADLGAAGVATTAADRTPIPTPTRTNIERRVDSLATRTGLSGRTFLGTSVTHWLELAGALLREDAQDFRAGNRRKIFFEQ